jgi:mercuric reductase
VDPTYRTSLPHIYSAGDCVALPLRLETTAGREGTISAENALMEKELTLDLGKVPYTLFTSPSLAGVGLTEKQVIERYGRCSCRTVELSQIPRAILEGESTGTVKIVVEPQTERILGVHILAPHAGELIALATALLSSGSTLEDLRSLLLPFPTYSEALKLCAVSFTTELDRLSCCV